AEAVVVAEAVDVQAVVGRVGVDLEADRPPAVHADVGGETLDARIAGADHVPFTGRISGKRVLGDDGVLGSSGSCREEPNARDQQKRARQPPAQRLPRKAGVLEAERGVRGGKHIAIDASIGAGGAKSARGGPAVAALQGLCVVLASWSGDWAGSSGTRRSACARVTGRGPGRRWAVSRRSGRSCRPSQLERSGGWYGASIGRGG